LDASQYLGTAAQGLEFFHIDVVEEENRARYLKFLDNCAILTVEEGSIEEKEIVEGLEKLFDQNWHWQVRELEDFKYLVRFPPHMQIVATLISDVTYFKMKKGGVLVLLRAWTRDIEPYDPGEIWVQVRGIPPRWCNWRTISQVSSSLGKLVEVDWSSLFTSFFGMVKVKVACKDGSKIPGKRPFEMKKKTYTLSSSE
jgi:hypothetical protein